VLLRWHEKEHRHPNSHQYGQGYPKAGVAEAECIANSKPLFNEQCRIVPIDVPT